MKYVYLLLALLITANANASLNDAADSIVQITHSNGLGTGFCFKEDTKLYYLMTAGHCCQSEKVAINLFHGEKSIQIPAEIVEKAFMGPLAINIDGAVLTVKKEDLKDYQKLSVVPLITEEEAKGGVSGVIWTYGCPKGGFPTAYKGRIIGVKNEEIYFTPTALKGRSGSPIFNEKCDRVIGMVVRWQPVDTSVPEEDWKPKHGIAISVPYIRTILSKETLGTQ